MEQKVRQERPGDGFRGEFCPSLSTSPYGATSRAGQFGSVWTGKCGSNELLWVMVAGSLLGFTERWCYEAPANPSPAGKVLPIQGPLGPLLFLQAKPQELESCPHIPKALGSHPLTLS